MHDYSGVTGRITVNSTIVGFVKADVSFEYVTGKYFTVGSEVGQHTRGPKKVSGTLTKAWGVDTEDLYNLFNNRTEFNIDFEASTDGSAEKYTASGCVLTGLKISEEAGSEDALVIDAPFEGRDWSKTAPTA